MLEIIFLLLYSFLLCTRHCIISYWFIFKHVNRCTWQEQLCHFACLFYIYMPDWCSLLISLCMSLLSVYFHIFGFVCMFVQFFSRFLHLSSNTYFCFWVWSFCLHQPQLGMSLKFCGSYGWLLWILYIYFITVLLLPQASGFNPLTWNIFCAFPHTLFNVTVSLSSTCQLDLTLLRHLWWDFLTIIDFRYLYHLFCSSFIV